MKAELKLAWKYFRLRRKSVVRLTSIIARTTLALGIAVMITAQALSRGFAEEIKQKILINTPHINIFRKDGSEIKDWQELTTRINSIENVASIETLSYREVTITKDGKMSYCIAQARNSQNKVAIGKELASKMGLSIGNTTELILLDEQEIKRIEIRIDEIIQTGLFDYDSTWILLPPETFGKLLGKKSPNVLKVSLKDVYLSNETARRIKDSLGEEYEILDWQEANQPLFNALALERKVTFIIVSLLILIASLNITTTLALLVNERKLDIAVLKVVGARAKSLILIFFFEGMMLAISGATIGLLIGLSACFVANRFELIRLQKEIYTISSISLHPSFFDIGLILASAFLLSLVSIIYPAFHASRLKPAEILRKL